MKIEKFELRGGYPLCAGVFKLVRGRAPAHLRENPASNKTTGSQT
jgi:hypothetical protein